MKKFFSLLSSLVLGAVNAQTTEPPVLQDAQLAKEANFDIAILEELRMYTKSSFTKFDTEVYATDSETGTVYKNDAIAFTAKEKDAAKIMEELRDAFAAKGYLLFMTERNYGYDPDTVVVFKTTDQFLLPERIGTNGLNYDIETEDVIQQLKRWHAKAPFTIIGCGTDFIEARFIKQPKNMLAFAEEVYEFCPDTVDQGAGSVEELAEEMEKNNVFYLWWD